MTMRETCDEGARARSLESLPRLRPDPARADSVRRRCRRQMTRRSRARGTDTLARRLDRVFLPALLVAFSALYAAALVGTTLRVERLLR